MGYREVYTAANMAGEEYNISDRGLSITPEKISISVRPGGSAEGQFVVAGPPGTAVTGFLTSDSFHMQLRRDSFAENPDRISWRFDAGALGEGEVCEGTIGIVSGRGEYKLPFRAEVVTPQIAGRELQEIPHPNAAAERFLRLADEDWGSAVRLFYRKEFAQSLLTDEEKMLYRGLARYPGNEQNVEEFLIAACGKDPVEFLVDTKEVRREILEIGSGFGSAEPTDCRITIRRRGWGFCRLKVTMAGSFLSPVSAVLGGEDFIGDSCTFTYRVEKHRLHPGRNFGRIYLSSPYQEIRIPVEIVYRRRSDGKARQERESRRALIEIMRHYERLHVGWAREAQGMESGIDNGEWLRQADELVKRLSYLRRDSTLPRLYAAQLLLMENRIHQAIMELESVRRKLAGVASGEVLEMGYSQYPGESDIEYCYRQFLTALAYHDADVITPRVGRILRERYRRNPADWRIAWMMMQLLPEYAPGLPARWNFLKKQYTNGARSPILYMEAWDMIYADPSYLNLQEDRRTGRYGGDAFERQVLVYAMKRGLLDPGTMEKVLERTERRREFSQALYYILTRAYSLERMRPLQIPILRNLCTLLIRGNRTGADCFVWYSRAVEKGLNLVRLSECFLQSMPEDYSGVIPDSVMRTSYRGSMLSNGSRAYFYLYLYRNRSKYADVFEQCAEDIRTFLELQISEHRMTENLAELYTVALRDESIRPSNAGDLTKLSYLSHLRTTHLYMKKAVTVYAQSSKERVYPMEGGNCILPIYGDDNRIFLEDAQHNRYTASVPYTCDRMMEPVGTPDQVSLQEMADLPFAMEISGVTDESFEVTDETLRYCEILVRSASVAPSYRVRLKLRLMDYYERSGDMEKLRAMAGTLEAGELRPEDCVRTIKLMNRCGMYDEAVEWITLCGIEKCPADVLSDTALGAAAGDRQDSERCQKAGRIAWAAFERGDNRRRILELILEWYDGLSEDLQRVRDALLEVTDEEAEEDLAVTVAEDRLLAQTLFSGEMLRGQEDLLLRQYGRGEKHRELAGAGIAQYCHYVFADWRQMDPRIMRLIAQADGEGNSMPPICRLAYLKTLVDRADRAGQSEPLTEEEAATAERFLLSLLKEEIVFPFYRQFTGTGPALRLYDRETMIEYHNPAGVRGTRGHVVIHCSLDRGGRQEPFMAREMKEMVRGFYVSSFFLFYGEQVHYFITDDPEEKNIVESGTIGQDARIDPAQDDRFAQIDAISRAAAHREREKAAALISEYMKKEYLTDTLFGTEEDSDAIYQIT
ncbi:MAG: hypothetical protein IJ198_05200 [Lachnospiraceae bacterium]|nr:hypothetical protein [Lachnospiraceae bacterium]